MPNTCHGHLQYRRVLHTVCCALPSATSCFNLIGGDWNFALEEEGRQSDDGGHWEAGDRWHTTYFGAKCARWAELYQPDPTRYGWGNDG
eukprot:3186907-Pyramimonas_sp.AAC.1